MPSDQPDGDATRPEVTDAVARLEAAVQGLRERLDRLEAAQVAVRQPGGSRTPPSAWQRWREERRGLGASLALTGFVAGITGILLHFALRTQAIDTTVHLGYLIGLTGLLLFLIGLFIVF